MPAATASRRSAYSWSEIDSTEELARALPVRFLVGGKFFYCLSDFFWVRHVEVFLWCVERHGRDVGGGHSHHWSIEVVEGVLRDDRRPLGAKAPGPVVLVDDHRLARLSHRRQDRVSI